MVDFLARQAAIHALPTGRRMTGKRTGDGAPITVEELDDGTWIVKTPEFEAVFMTESHAIAVYKTAVANKTDA